MPLPEELSTPEPARPSSVGWRVFLFIELIALYVGLPLGIWWLHQLESRPPVIPTLIIVGGLFLFILVRRHPRTLLDVLHWRGPRAELKRIFTIFSAAAVALAIYTSVVEPELLFRLLREKTGVWLGILVLYPVLSVVPQELVFRVFLFRRYRALLPSLAARAVVSALLFGYAHLIYGNGYSIVLSTLGGLLFALTYLRTRSIWVVSIEHALYGIFLFTIGLGAYFH